MMSRTTYLAVAAAFLWIAGESLCQAQSKPVEEQIVDDFNKLFGVHAGFRANHAKGLVVEGHFKASPEAAKLSKAIIFSGNTFPVTVRFSDSTGVPNIPDGSPNASPHGISIKYHLPDGSDTDMVLNSFKFFPVATGADFRDFLDSVAASPANAPKPTKMELFIKAHPTVLKSLATVATPDSFADEQYNGVDAFVFVDKDGKKQAVRYIVVPEKLVHLSDADAAKEPPNFLMDELTQRLAKGPVVFHLKAQLAQPGDQTKDPSQPWPADRPVVDLGVLTIDKAVPNSLDAQKQLFFLPGQLVDGIEKSDDPLIDTRDNAYAISYSRRSQ
ncbi:MAG: catalase family peroxidase [Methylovirgula sp.]